MGEVLPSQVAVGRNRNRVRVYRTHEEDTVGSIFAISHTIQHGSSQRTYPVTEVFGYHYAVVRAHRAIGRIVCSRGVHVTSSRARAYLEPCITVIRTYRFHIVIQRVGGIYIGQYRTIGDGGCIGCIIQIRDGYALGRGEVARHIAIHAEHVRGLRDGSIHILRVDVGTTGSRIERAEHNVGSGIAAHIRHNDNVVDRFQRRTEIQIICRGGCFQSRPARATSQLHPDSHIDVFTQIHGTGIRVIIVITRAECKRSYNRRHKPGGLYQLIFHTVVCF